MFEPDHSLDLPTSDLLAELGIDPTAVREVIEDDRAIRCPERGAVYPAFGFADPRPGTGAGTGPARGGAAAEPWDPASSLPPAE